MKMYSLFITVDLWSRKQPVWSDVCMQVAQFFPEVAQKVAVAILT